MKPGYYLDWAGDIMIVYPNGKADILYYGVNYIDWLEQTEPLTEAEYIGPL